MKTPLLLEQLARPLYPLLLVGAVVVLLRGHDAPGGGFVAGLIAVAASGLWAFAHGARAARGRLPLRSPLALAGAGMLLSVGAGLPSVVILARPFLSHLAVPGLPSTAVLFDAGVALAVWGAMASLVLPLVGEEPTS